MPKASSRPPRSSSRLADFWPGNHRRCSYAISQPCTTPRASGPQPLSFRCRRIYSLISPHDRTRRSDFDQKQLWPSVANPRADNGLALLVDHDGMEIEVRQSVCRGVDLLAMHVGNNDDIDQCRNGAAVASAAQLPHAKLHRVLTRE